MPHCFYGPRYVSRPPFMERLRTFERVDCVRLQQQVIHMYIFEYSLMIMVNDVKLTVPKWQMHQRIWNGWIGLLYIYASNIQARWRIWH